MVWEPVIFAALQRLAVHMMIPGFRRLLLRRLPIEILNSVRTHDIPADFTSLADLPISVVVDKIEWSEEKTRKQFLETYWQAVDAGLLVCDKPEARRKGHYYTSWIHGLLEHWSHIGRLPFADKDGVKYVNRDDLRRVFKENRITFPITWR